MSALTADNNRSALWILKRIWSCAFFNRLYPDGFLYVRDNDEYSVLGDFKLAFYSFENETDIELANNCGKRGMTKGGLFSKSELTAKAGRFERIGDLCFVEVDENGSLARVSLSKPMNAVLM